MIFIPNYYKTEKNKHFVCEGKGAQTSNQYLPHLKNKLMQWPLYWENLSIE